MHLGIDFWKDLEGFWEPKWCHVGTQIDQKSMWFAKSGFSKNYCFSLGKTIIFKVRGVQVESQNRLKIDWTSKSKIEGLWASIFRGFLWVLGGKLGGKIEPRAIKHRFKKASNKWTVAKLQHSCNIASWVWGFHGARKARRRSWDPLIDQNQRNQPTGNRQTFKHALRAEARCRICI